MKGVMEQKEMGMGREGRKGRKGKEVELRRFLRLLPSRSEPFLLPASRIISHPCYSTRQSLTQRIYDPAKPSFTKLERSSQKRNEKVES